MAQTVKRNTKANPSKTVKTVEQCMNLTDVQHMGELYKVCHKLITLSKSTVALQHMCQETQAERSEQQLTKHAKTLKRQEVSARDFDVVR